MSLASAARIAQSGLTTATSEIAVSARNISGANSTSFFSQKIANVFPVGSGTSQTVTVTNAQNQAVFNNVLSATASSATQTALANGLTQLNNTIGSVASSSTSQSSPAALLSNFQDALQSLEASPSDSSLANAAVTAASQLTGGLNSASATVQQVRQQADAGMASSVQTINGLLAQFQTANTEVVQGTATGADVTNAEDTRDGLLTQLAQQIGITTNTGANGDMSIYTDSGATLFQGTARSVTFAPTSTYTAGTTGNAVYVDGVAVTGSSATMPIGSGALAGLATLRDDTTVTYQSQLDAMAGSLVSTFAESDQSGGGGPNLPGLFTTAGATALPTSTTGLASQIAVNASVDPSQGGNAMLLRDGGISDTANSNYTYNTSGEASYSGRLSQLVSAMSQTQSFSAAGGIATSATLSDYASDSVSWLEGQRSTVSSQSDYQSSLLSTATTALSSATGVNLDDEMSKMLDLENSYSASAKLLSTINTVFDTFVTDIGQIPVP